VVSALILAACNGPSESEPELEHPEFTRVTEENGSLFTSIAGLTLGSTIEDVIKAKGADAIEPGSLGLCNDKLTPGDCHLFLKPTADLFGGSRYQLTGLFEDYKLIRVILTVNEQEDKDMCLQRYEAMLDGLTERYGTFFLSTHPDYAGVSKRTLGGNGYKIDDEDGQFFIPSQRTFRGSLTDAKRATEHDTWGGGNYVEVMAYNLDAEAPCNVTVDLVQGPV
jgi:hypothetical protein